MLILVIMPSELPNTKKKTLNPLVHATEGTFCFYFLSSFTLCNNPRK